MPIHKDELNIVIAGDSRAERQLDPYVISSLTGLNTINIAVNGGDLVSTVTAIKNNYKNDKCIFVISTSSWQVNDGAIDAGYLSSKCFSSLSIVELFRIYKSDFPEFLRMFKKNLYWVFDTYTQSTTTQYDDKVISRKGFRNIKGVFDTSVSGDYVERHIQNHSWYKNIKTGGGRERVFVESINELLELDQHFIVIQPPVSQFWKESTINTEIDVFEKYFTNLLNEKTLHIPNVSFLDYYTPNDSTFMIDSLYYDYQHFNENGAILFSKEIAYKIDSIRKITN